MAIESLKQSLREALCRHWVRCGVQRCGKQSGEAQYCRVEPDCGDEGSHEPPESLSSRPTSAAPMAWRSCGSQGKNRSQPHHIADQG